MSNEPIPNDPTDDELESLAQDLFGVSLNEETKLEPFDVGDFDLDELEPDDEAAQVVDEASASEDGDPDVSDSVDDGFGASVLDDEDDAPPPAKRSSDLADDRQDEPVAEEPAEQEQEEQAAETATKASGKAEDDYWDALDGFDWNEGSDASQPKSQMSKEYVETSETFEDLSIESAAKTDEFLDDADFGAGLDEQDDVVEESSPQQTVASGGDDDESEKPAERKGRRRRGRRRRGRKPAQEGEGRGASSATDEDFGKEPTDEGEEPEEVVDRSEPATSDDSFGAGLDFEEESEDRPKKSRRRRGGRRRGRRRTSEDSSEAETAATAADEESDAPPPTSQDRASTAKDSEKSSRRSREGKYRSVPTWEGSDQLPGSSDSEERR